MTKRVLVTGGTGFIGHHLVRRLVSTDVHVRLLCRRDSDLAHVREVATLIELCYGDLKDPVSLAEAVTGIDVMFHLAAATRGNWAEAYQATVKGTEHLLDYAQRTGVPRVVYVSSMSVYDYARMPRDATVDENAPLETRPETRTVYARSKCEAEAIVRRYLNASDIAVCILRPGAVYGPGGPPHIPATFRFARDKSVFLIGGGLRQIPLVYVENLIDALLLAAESHQAIGQVYNVVDSPPVIERLYVSKYLGRLKSRQMPVIPLPTLPFLVAAHFYDLVARATGRHPNADMYRAVKRVTNRIFFSARKISQDLGWRSRVSLDEGLQASVGGSH